MNENKENIKKPSLVLQQGLNKLVVWSNSVEKDGKTFSNDTIQFERAYKDGEEWKTTKSFSYKDLESLKLLIDEALKSKFPVKVRSSDEE